MIRQQHEASSECWCEPVLLFRAKLPKREVWMHRYAGALIHSRGLHMALGARNCSAVFEEAIKMAENPNDARWPG